MPAAPQTPLIRFPRPVLSEPSAAQTMDLIQQYMKANIEMLRRVGLEELADEYGGLDREQKERLNTAMDRVRPEYQHHMISAAQDYRPYRFWLENREAYEPHPGMTRALVNMSADTTVPGSVFRRLRHINPMFLLPGAPPITHADGHPGRILAILITGALSKRHRATGNASIADDAPGNASVLMDTIDANANAFHALVLSEVHNTEGTEVIDMDWCHLTVPIVDAFTLDDLVRATALDGFRWEPEMNADATTTHDSRQQYMLTAARTVVSHLLYACSRTVELEDKPRGSRPPAKRKPGQPKPPRAAKIWRMGWRLGASIADSLWRVADPRPDQPGTGRTVAPHMRSAHLHIYRVGEGRREIDVKWLDPIPVNAAKDDGVTITSHPMR
jgi:hypothetical protein